MRYAPVIAILVLVGAAASNGQDSMTFHVEDLPDAGLVLVPSSSADYIPLLADIQQRIDHPPPGPAIMPEQLRRMMVGKITPEKRSTSAILLNKSGKSIAALALIWRYEDLNGRITTGSSSNTFGRAVLLPFGIPPSSLKLQAYWSTILPGSERYLGENEMAGDNTDVRLPGPDEIWTGGGFGFGSGGGARQYFALKSVTLVIDGAFFTDGEFAGPNQVGLWENVTTEAKSRMEIAKMARDGKDRGAPSAEILDRIGKLTGPATNRPPPPPPPGSRTPEEALAFSVRLTRQTLANQIARQRQSIGDDRTVDRVAAQADTSLPDFRKR